MRGIYDQQIEITGTGEVLGGRLANLVGGGKMNKAIGEVDVRAFEFAFEKSLRPLGNGADLVDGFRRHDAGYKAMAAPAQASSEQRLLLLAQLLEAFFVASLNGTQQLKGARRRDGVERIQRSGLLDRHEDFFGARQISIFAQ